MFSVPHLGVCVWDGTKRRPHRPCFIIEKIFCLLVPENFCSRVYIVVMMSVFLVVCLHPLGVLTPNNIMSNINMHIQEHFSLSFLLEIIHEYTNTRVMGFISPVGDMKVRM